VSTTLIVREHERYAEVEDTSWGREAVQAHSHRKDHAQSSTEATHPHQQKHEAETEASRHDDRLGG
jgi:hypothetical protein